MAKKKKKKKKDNFKLTSLIQVGKTIERRYSAFASTMNFILCIESKPNHYYFFQEISSLPFTNIFVDERNRSIFISADWNNLEKRQMKVKDNSTEYLKWDDVEDMSTEYSMNDNAQLVSYGQYSNGWRSKKKDRHFKTSFDLRIEFINKVNLCEWGFEIFSNTLSLIAFKQSTLFPYDINDKKENLYLNRTYNTKMEGVRVGKIGNFFSIEHNNPYVKNGIVNSWSYSINKDDRDFDELMDRLAMGNKEELKTKKIGRDMDIIL